MTNSPVKHGFDSYTGFTVRYDLGDRTRHIGFMEFADILDFAACALRFGGFDYIEVWGWNDDGDYDGLFHLGEKRRECRLCGI